MNSTFFTRLAFLVFALEFRLFNTDIKLEGGFYDATACLVSVGKVFLPVDLLLRGVCENVQVLK